MINIVGEGRALVIMVPTLIIVGITYMIPLKKRKNYTGGFLVVLCLIVAGTIAGAKYLTFTRSVTIAVYIALYLFLVLMIWTVCRISFTESIYCAACAYLTQHLFYSARTALAEFGQYGSGRFGAGILMECLFYYLPLTVFCVPLYFLFIKQLVKDGRYRIESRQSLALMIITLLSTIVLSHFSTVFGHETKGGGMLFGICRVYAMLCCIVILWAQYNKSKELALQEQMMAERELRRQQMSQFESYQENLELINYKCHDLKQQVAALRSIGGKVPEEVLTRVEESVMIYDAYVKTGNEILDTILTEKNLWCEKNGITMACMVDGKSLEFMETVDIFAIFGNALANAVESVSQIEEPDKRMISVLSFVRMDVVFIQFENYYESEVIRHGELPESTKDRDGSHGYGLKSIRYSVQKYGGCMTIDTEEHIFKLQISIPSFSSPSAGGVKVPQAPDISCL